ncbi:MAG TPA: lamin tail domain-containing protein [Anaerolineae bacterium]
MINEILADPASDANGDGTSSTTQDELIEIVNNTRTIINLGGWELHDAVGLRHTFSGDTVLSDGCAVVVFGGGTPAGDFGGSLVQIASTGQLGLNNGGDTLTLYDLTTTAVVSYTFGSEGGDDQSLTRDPDIIGAEPLVRHTQATGSNGARFSPGVHIDGTPFIACPQPPTPTPTATASPSPTFTSTFTPTSTPTSTSTPTRTGTPKPALVINEIHADPHANLGDANGDGTVSTSQDEFIEIVNNTGADANLAGWTLNDGVGVRHIFPTNTIVVNGCSIVVFSGGTPSGTFGNGVVQTASTGSLGLNNTGDSVTLLDTGPITITTYAFGSEANHDQSLTRSPDIIGPEPLITHTLAAGDNSILFSPGTRVDGSRFAGCPTMPPTPTLAPTATPTRTPTFTRTPTATRTRTPTVTSAGTPTRTRTPTPGQPVTPASPPAPGLVINEIHADPDSTLGDANGDGLISSTQDEFIEIVNNTGAPIDLSGWAVHDGVGLRHTYPPGSILLNGCSIVVFSGGTPGGDFGNSLVQTASTGSLGLNNTGDSVTVFDSGSTVIATYTYGREGGDNQSLTRGPDIVGPDPLIKHSAAAGSNGALFSPGTKVDGSPFAGCMIAPPALIRIREIQGATHRSALIGQTVQDVPGLVTALTSNGFYLQDSEPDDAAATSEGIFVYTASAPAVALGDAVQVDASVSEFYPGGFASGDLSITELISPTITIVSSGHPLPAPMTIGAGGRIPPSQIIEDDTTGDVETGGVFDPGTDGIDFYESLEGMRVQIDSAIVVGPASDSGEIVVVGDGGANAELRSPRGALVVRPGDFNPERLILDDALMPLPAVSVGDTFLAPIVGVMDYSLGNFKLLITAPPVSAPGGLVAETATGPAANQLSVAAFNVENLDPGDEAAKFTALADQIVNHLRAPDIIALEEVQDNSGASDDGTVDARLTYTRLITAILSAGGPGYEYRDIAPVDGQDGGEPGGNIRQGFLFRPDRATFVDRPGGDATTAVTATLGISGTQLSISPGRIDPTHPAFENSRKPLAAEFTFNDHTIVVIANHFRSKRGDDPLFGRVQPPVAASEAQRIRQAQIVNGFVDSILALDPDASVIALGDLNDFPFSAAVTTLAGDALTNLITTLPAEERYTFIADGNAQALDHILVSPHVLEVPAGLDIVHTNAEFASSNRPTDHDPVLARFRLEPVAAPAWRIYLPIVLSAAEPIHGEHGHARTIR